MKWLPVADQDGRVFLMPAVTFNRLRAAGQEAFTTTLFLDASIQTASWLTITEAAREHCEDVDGMTVKRAAVKIGRACSSGKIRAEGNRSRRRIDPTSFAAWRLAERERDLDQQNNDCRPRLVQQAL